MDIPLTNAKSEATLLLVGFSGVDDRIARKDPAE